MCGICGIVDFRDRLDSDEQIRAMMHSMRHRGPDDDGTFCEGNLGLGFVRLSVLDLTSAGRQPMASDDGRFQIVFNGEIFNYIELREELRGSGHQFHTGTDTEVLLAAWQQWGSDCLHRLNGMWAFSVYDRQKKRLYAARDRYGIKPFYYSVSGQRFIFASEVPAILELKDVRRAENREAIFNFLVYNRTDYDESTFFEGIKRLQHGHMLEMDLSDAGSLRITKWYDLQERVRDAAPFMGTEDFKEGLSTAVRLRQRSDVPVGVCLSGGLDSSAIVSLILEDSDAGTELNTFSAVYGEGFKGDETAFINEYSKSLDRMHFVRPTGTRLSDELEEFVRAHGEPMPSTSPFAQYCVMKKAREHVVVTLDGQGADELLAGYHYFFGYKFKELLCSAEIGQLRRAVGSYWRRHRSTYGLQCLAFFLLPEVIQRKARLQQSSFVHSDLRNMRPQSDVVAERVYGSGSLREAGLDHFEHKLEHLLKWEDRNSMFHSVEARVPFLDVHLVEKTLAMGDEHIMADGWTKQVLREAMNGVLPESIRLRTDKIGFATPADDWFRQEPLRSLAVDIVSSSSFAGRQVVDPHKALKLLKRHLSGKTNVGQEIWKWLNLELWFREFIDTA